ncbi:MAG: hypothetical protein ACLFSQ_11410 [Candidatus Zixiibacteriota bacterium]
MDKRNDAKVLSKNMKLIAAVILIGALCGLSEIFISEFLRIHNFPFRAGLLTGIGFGLIAIVIAIFRKPVLALGIAAIAIFTKQLIVPFAGMAIGCKLNSCLAVGLEYGALAAIAGIGFTSMQKNTRSRIALSFGAAFLGAGLFRMIGMHVAPCNYLRSFATAAGFGSFMIREGLSWAVFSATFFPIGWLVGERIRETSLDFMKTHPALYYSATLSLSALIFAIVAYYYSFLYNIG